MALTPEQQAELAFQKAMEDVRNENTKALEKSRLDAQAAVTAAHETQRAENLAEHETQRAANQAAEEAQRAKLELVRMAKEILVENRRTKTPAEAADITPEAVSALATELASAMNS